MAEEGKTGVLPYLPNGIFLPVLLEAEDEAFHHDAVVGTRVA